MRIHADRRPVEGSRLPHARRLRSRSGARDVERLQGVPDHRFRIPGRRTRAGVARQSALYLRLQANAASRSLRPRVLAEHDQGKANRVHRHFSGRSVALPLLPRNVQAGSADCARTEEDGRRQSPEGVFARHRLFRWQLPDPQWQGRLSWFGAVREGLGRPGGRFTRTGRGFLRQAHRQG